MTDPTVALERFPKLKCDIVLLDLTMEQLPGIEVLKRINEITEPRSRPAVVILTGDATMDAKHEALAAGATAFLMKPVDLIEVILRIENLLTTRDLYQRCQLYSEGLERLLDRRTAELREQRKKLDTELEFYQGDARKVPAHLKRQIEENEQQVAAQARFIENQEEEKKRINAHYDQELGRLRVLWAQRPALGAALMSRK